MFKKTKDEALEHEIACVYSAMKQTNRSSDEYKAMVNQLSSLYAIKNESSKTRVSKDTLAIVAGNLAGIMLIVGAEKTGVVTSKALTFLLKTR